MGAGGLFVRELWELQGGSKLGSRPRLERVCSGAGLSLELGFEQCTPHTRRTTFFQHVFVAESYDSVVLKSGPVDSIMMSDERYGKLATMMLIAVGESGEPRVPKGGSALVWWWSGYFDNRP